MNFEQQIFCHWSAFRVDSSHLNTLFIFYKNVVFPALAEYSYFSVEFCLKIFLYYSEIIGCDISALECIGGIN